jgi:hypothetical protein
MRQFVKFSSTGVLSALMVSSVWAQAGGGATGGGAAGGQTGAKGGTTGTVGTTGMTIGQTPWFNNQALRTHIGLNDQSFNQLNTAYGQAYQNYNTGASQLGVNLTPQQRAQRMQDLHSAFNQKMSQAAQSTITDPTQLSRYNQLYLQFQGVGAFNAPQVQQKLNLTDQQRQQFQQFAQQYNQQVSTLQQNAQTNPQATNQQFDRLRQQSMQNINSVLTPQQQQMWQQMAGQPYNLQWSHYFPPTTTGGAQQIPKQ